MAAVAGFTRAPSARILSGMRFTERSAPPPAARPARPASTVADPYPAGAGHRTLALYWANEMRKALTAAIANPEPTTIEDLEMNHVVRCAKQMAYHGFRVLGKERTR